MKYIKSDIAKIANDNNYIVDTLEKVLRLSDILKFINTTIYKEKLVLKGGTAINLILFNLPRLSVDIDLDYHNYESKEQMLIDRDKIDKIIRKFMYSQKYELSSKSKFTEVLDSYVYNYITLVVTKIILK